MNFIDKIRINIREKLNPFLSPYRRSKILNFDNTVIEAPFTILSNNCWGGHVYRYFGFPYNTPTVGMYFFSGDYIKFLTKLDHYLTVDLIMIGSKESKHYEELVKYHKESLNVPIGRLDDIEIVFLHSHSPEEAFIKWNRRKQRINKDNLIVKMSQMNGCTYEHLRAFDELPYKRKFVFTTKDYGLKSQVIFKECLGENEILNDTTNFRKYVDLIKLINGEPFRIN